MKIIINNNIILNKNNNQIDFLHFDNKYINKY